MNAVTYRPMARAAWRPALRGRKPRQLSQAEPNTPGVATVLLPIVGLGFTGAVAYFGLRAGIKGGGAAQVFGWIFGLTGAVVSLNTLGTLFLGGAQSQQIAQQQTPSP